MGLMITIGIVVIQPGLLREPVLNYSFVDLVKCIEEITVSQYK